MVLVLNGQKDFVQFRYFEALQEQEYQHQHYLEIIFDLESYF